MDSQQLVTFSHGYQHRLMISHQTFMLSGSYSVFHIIKSAFIGVDAKPKCLMLLIVRDIVHLT